MYRRMLLPASVPGGTPKRRCAAALASRISAVGAHGEDGGGAAVDQELELFLGGAPGGGLLLDAVEVLQFPPAAASRDFIGEQPCAGQCGEYQESSWGAKRRRSKPWGRKIGQQGAGERGEEDGPTATQSRDQEHRKQVKEPEGYGRIHVPVDQRNYDHRERGERGPNPHAGILELH